MWSNLDNNLDYTENKYLANLDIKQKSQATKSGFFVLTLQFLKLSTQMSTRRFLKSIKR